MFCRVQVLPENIVQVDLHKTKKFRICFLGDIQYGAPSVNLELLQRTIEREVEAGAYFVGMGDYIDPGTIREMGGIDQSKVHESTRKLIDDRISELVHELLNILAPTKGRWWGMLSGHHNWQYLWGATVDHQIAHALSAPYLGHNGLIVAKIPAFHRKKIKNIIQIMALHGEGSGVTHAALMNRLMRLAWAFPTVDIFAHGHHHRMVAGREVRFFFSLHAQGVSAITRPVLLIGTGGFLGAYEPMPAPEGGSEEFYEKIAHDMTRSYVERKGLQPRANGAAVVEIELYRERSKGKDHINYDFHAII